MKQKRVRAAVRDDGSTYLIEEYWFDHGPRCTTRHTRMGRSKVGVGMHGPGKRSGGTDINARALALYRKAAGIEWWQHPKGEQTNA